jgi:hypothetical protein
MLQWTSWVQQGSHSLEPFLLLKGGRNIPLNIPEPSVPPPEPQPLGKQAWLTGLLSPKGNTEWVKMSNRQRLFYFHKSYHLYHKQNQGKLKTLFPRDLPNITC